jgi:hypothetical protein
VKKFIYMHRRVVADIYFNDNRFQPCGGHNIQWVAECTEEFHISGIKELQVAGIEHNALGVDFVVADPVGVPTPVTHSRSLSHRRCGVKKFVSAVLLIGIGVGLGFLVRLIWPSGESKRL